MSYIVVGEHIPAECRGTCPQCIYEQGEPPYCWFMGKPVPADGGRPEWCPLIPLPEKHGDLMDKAAFESDVRNRYCHGCDNSNGIKCRACWVDDMLDEVACAPTVIAAEGGTGNAD